MKLNGVPLNGIEETYRSITGQFSLFANEKEVTRLFETKNLSSLLETYLLEILSDQFASFQVHEHLRIHSA